MKRMFFTVIAFIGVQTATAQNDGKSIDPKLVGCWQGTEVKQWEKGISKQWRTCRFANGNLVFSFVLVDENDKVTESQEKGSWWVENGKFYETIEGENVIDEYVYEFVGDSIQFTETKITGYKNTPYTFMDHKIEN